MTKFIDTLTRAVALREFTVTLVPFNGGKPITIKKVIAGSPDLAMRDATQTNPGYIAQTARCTKVLVAKGEER